MKEKIDLRIQKTKNALYNAFFSMLEDMTFEEITVNALCEKADIRRATFYKHYSDKLDFLNSVTKQLRHRFDHIRWLGDTNNYSESDYYVAYAKRVVKFIDEHEKIVDNLLKSDLLATIINVITEQNYIDTAERLKKSSSSGIVLKASPKVVAMMCSGGVAHILMHWITEGRKTSPDELAEEIGILVSAII